MLSVTFASSLRSMQSDLFYLRTRQQVSKRKSYYQSKKQYICGAEISQIWPKRLRDQFSSESPWSWVTSIQRPRKVSTCAWLPLFTSEAKSLWFWSHKKVASSRLELELCVQLGTVVGVWQRDGGPAARKKSNLAHHITWPDLIQSRGCPSLAKPIHGGEKTAHAKLDWKESSEEYIVGTSLLLFCLSWNFSFIIILSCCFKCAVCVSVK